MIRFKSEQEIEAMKEGGDILRRVVEKLLPDVRDGVSTGELDEKARELIRAFGADTSFDKVPGYRWVLCTPINNQIVHTPPSKRVIKTGDLVTVDIGVYYKGYHTDYATTLLVGETNNKKKNKFLEVGKETLEKALKKAGSGVFLGEISRLIDLETSKAGYKVIKQLTGHGIGRNLHEDPFVPQFLDRKIENTLVMQPGFTIAIEVIYSESTHEMKHEREDEWSIVTADGSMSAQFEHTIAITGKDTVILA